MKYKAGDVIKTEKGLIKIEQLLGEGGQGTVYKVDFNGEKKALKVYLAPVPKAVEKSLLNLSKRPCISNAFVWPEYAFIENGVIHYIMKLRPSGYISMDEVTSGNTRGIHYRERLAACINIVKAFRILHDSGYAFLDINHGGFFVDPKNGDVLIGDCDNIVPSGENPGNMLGFEGYIAPELIVSRSGKANNLGNVSPDKYTDSHSLAVLIHLMLTFQHPLMGPRYMKSDIAETGEADLELETFGLNPVYIMDPSNTSNRATPEIHENFLSIWNEFPNYMKELMYKAFSHDVLYVGNPNGKYSNRQNRLREKDWLDALFRLKSNTVICPSCGNDVFLQGKHPSCPKCGKLVDIKYAAKLSCAGYPVPLQGETELYKGQLMEANIDDHISDVYLRVVLSKSGALSLKNTSPDMLFRAQKDGHYADFKPGMVLPLSAGLEITINGNSKINIVELK